MVDVKINPVHRTNSYSIETKLKMNKKLEKKTSSLVERTAPPGKKSLIFPCWRHHHTNEIYKKTHQNGNFEQCQILQIIEYGEERVAVCA